MKITFSCSGCGKTLKASPDAAGRTRKCPVCATRVTCPARSAAPRRPAGRVPDDDVAEAEVVAIIPDAPAQVAAGARPAAAVAARGRSQPPSLSAAAPKPAFDPFDDLGDDPYQLAQPDPVSTAPPEPKKPCPMCGEIIYESAAKCRYCGEIFDARLKKSGSKKKKKKTTAGAGGGTGLRDLGIGVVVLILGIGLTVASYAHPATDGQGQGKFYIFHGFIIGGFAQTCKGLYDLIRGE